VVQVLDDGVRAGKKQTFVPVLAPADQPRWLAIGAVHFEDLGVSVRFPEMVALDHQPITNCCAHHITSCIDLRQAFWGSR